jgi:hypothetical protein
MGRQRFPMGSACIWGFWVVGPREERVCQGTVGGLRVPALQWQARSGTGQCCSLANGRSAGGVRVRYGVNVRG